MSKKFFIYSIAFLFVFLVFTFAHAQDALELPNPLSVNSIPELISGIFGNLVKYVVPPVAAIMIIVGAFQMLSAGGSPEKFATGKKTIMYTVAGIIVVLLGMVIAQLVAEILGADEAAQQIQQFRS